MKAFVVLVLIGLVSGCVSDVSTEPPYDQMIGTTWRLKETFYIVEYLDDGGKPYIYPPDRKGGYDKGKIGETVHGKKILSGILKGEVLMITRVLKKKNIEIGNMYYPMMILAIGSTEVDERELNGYWLYRGFSDKGILNPEYAEKVSIATNPPPRGAEAGGGSK